ncbi:hypothetical protein LEP1GSC052_3675 [Leptospira kmetyi serovar Malaysia str. Bejo-Iso9]|nr:hypothetical protein LEP1GSC052_3675 [Leptospira kmetyi serovar Malaysia str. Bejo-Iso9]
MRKNSFKNLERVSKIFLNKVKQFERKAIPYELKTNHFLNLNSFICRSIQSDSLQILM